MSSMYVSRHVRFGLPHLLHGVQSITRLAGLDVGRRSSGNIKIYMILKPKFREQEVKVGIS